MLELGDDVVVRTDGRGTSWPRLVLLRQSWPIKGGEALVGVTLEWSRKVDPGGSERPYAGIRVNKAAPGGETLMGLLRVMTKDPEVFKWDFRTSNHYWPALWVVERDPEWWRDIDTWRESVIEQFIASWHSASPLIDRAMMQLAASDEPT